MTRYDLREYLRKEGFNEDKVKYSMETLSKNQHLEVKATMDAVVYWTALVIAIVSNFVIIGFMVPFIITVQGIAQYLIVATAAVGFGLLFNLLIHDIEYTETKHHIIAGVFIPGIALVAIFVMVNLANFMINFLHLGIMTYSPWIISLVYVVFFMLPYIVSRYWKYMGK